MLHLEDEAGEGEEGGGVDARCGGEGRSACLAQPQQGDLQQGTHLQEQAAQLQHCPGVRAHLQSPRDELRLCTGNRLLASNRPNLPAVRTSPR